jgi:hypothetical protein
MDVGTQPTPMVENMPGGFAEYHGQTVGPTEAQ